MEKKSELKRGIGIMVASSIFASLGQLMWKISAESGIIYLVAGFGLYGIGALLMIVSYRHGKLSVLQPILSLNYVISIILGASFLSEKITVLKVTGVIIIVCGVILIASGGED